MTVSPFITVKPCKPGIGGEITTPVGDVVLAIQVNEFWWVDGCVRSGWLVSASQMPWYSVDAAIGSKTHCAPAAPLGRMGTAGRLMMALPAMLIAPDIVPPVSGNDGVAVGKAAHCPVWRPQICPAGTAGTSGTPAVDSIVSTYALLAAWLGWVGMVGETNSGPVMVEPVSSTARFATAALAASLTNGGTRDGSMPSTASCTEGSMISAIGTTVK